MIPLTIILAFMLDPGFPLTEEDLDLYSWRPVVEIEEERTLEEVEFDWWYEAERAAHDRRMQERNR